MAKQKFGLGRGLDALISGASDVMSTQQQSAQKSVEAVPVVLIDSIIPNPRQPRRVFKEDDPRLLELSASIKEHGLIQPIVVTRLDRTEAKKASTEGDQGWFAEETPVSQTAQNGGVQFQIIAGERRWRASKLAGLTEVPVVIKDVTPQQMLAMALIENIQRADLNPIEEAMAYQALMQEFGLTQEQVAKQVGKDRSTVANSVRLLQLPPAIREALISGVESFSEGHARTLIGIVHEESQIKAMKQIIALRLTVRQAEKLAESIKAAENIEEAAQQIAAVTRRSPELERLEAKFRNSLMVKVDVKQNEKGKGTIVLHFNNQEELDTLYERLTKKDEA